VPGAAARAAEAAGAAWQVHELLLPPLLLPLILMLVQLL